MCGRGAYATAGAVFFVAAALETGNQALFMLAMGLVMLLVDLLIAVDDMQQ